MVVKIVQRIIRKNDEDRPASEMMRCPSVAVIDVIWRLIRGPEVSRNYSNFGYFVPALSMEEVDIDSNF